MLDINTVLHKVFSHLNKLQSYVLNNINEIFMSLKFS